MDVDEGFDGDSKRLLYDESEWVIKPQVRVLEAVLMQWISGSVLLQLVSNGMIHMTEAFRSYAENLLPLCSYIVVHLHLYLKTASIDVAKYVLDVYDLGEGEYSELRPFIEVHVHVKDVDELLRIWRNAIDYLRSTLGDAVLERVDVFFTRAS